MLLYWGQQYVTQSVKCKKNHWVVKNYNVEMYTKVSPSSWHPMLYRSMAMLVWPVGQCPYRAVRFETTFNQLLNVPEEILRRCHQQQNLLMTPLESGVLFTESIITFSITLWIH